MSWYLRRLEGAQPDREVVERGKEFHAEYGSKLAGAERALKVSRILETVVFVLVLLAVVLWISFFWISFSSFWS